MNLRALCWYARVVLLEHALLVGKPDRSSQGPDGQTLRHELPFVGVTGEPFRRCGCASYRHDILDTNKSEAVLSFDVVKCFGMLDIEITEIGRASCRERVKFSVWPESLEDVERY